MSKYGIMDCSLPGLFVHGILQARILEWVVISFIRASSWPGIIPGFPALQADCLPDSITLVPLRSINQASKHCICYFFLWLACIQPFLLRPKHISLSFFVLCITTFSKIVSQEIKVGCVCVCVCVCMCVHVHAYISSKFSFILGWGETSQEKIKE